MDFGSGFNVAQEVGPNYLGGQMDGEARVAIHMAHRIGAILVSLVIGVLIFKLYRNAGSRELTRPTHVLLALLVIQVSLGLSNIIFSLPLWVAVAHNAGGALLLLTLVTLNYRLSKVSAF
jgi:cytochrome c oxidase assembly protein subunit 15